MRNSTIKAIVGPCLDCNRNTFLTAGRCKIHYAKHRAKVCADRKANRETPNEPVKPIKIVASRKVSSLLSKSIEQLKGLAQDAFNAYIRKRDAIGDYFICISCDEQKPKNKMDAGHYYSRGNHSYLRYNENNVHGQCRKCNSFLSGHLTPYRENLLIKIGQEELERLDANRNKPYKPSKIELVGIIQLYRDKIKKDFL